MSENSGDIGESIGIDLQESLAAAIKAARKAGHIIREAIEARRAAIAAYAPPTGLPTQSTTFSEQQEKDNPPQPKLLPGEEEIDQPTQVVDAKDHAAVKVTTSSALSGHLCAFTTKEGPSDVVTEYDRRCESVILTCLREYSEQVQLDKPHLKFSFITEELNPDAPLTNELTWIVDPIDGTMSFMHGLPDCCVSIGLTWKKEPVLAVVYNPFLVTGHIGVDQAVEIKQQITSVLRAYAIDDSNKFYRKTSVAKTHPRISLLPPLQPPMSSMPGGGSVDPASRSILHPTGNSWEDRSNLAASRRGGTEIVGELFTAIKGKGCFLNGIRVNVNADATPATAMAVINYPLTVRLSEAEAAAAATTEDEERIRKAKREKAIDAVARVRARLLKGLVPSLRSYGSGVLTLSQIAAGRVDVFVDPASKAWDVCAGALLVTEAGGIVRNLYGRPFNMAHDTTITAGANEAVATYVSHACAKESLGKYWLLED